MDGSSRATILGSVIAIAAAVAGCTAYFTWRRRGLPPSKKKRRTDKPRYKVDRHMVHVVSTGDEWEEVRPKVEADLKILKALGVDCEWVGTNPIALIQLATHTGICVLVRVQRLPSVPDSLKAILADKGILKLGVAICDDAHRLHKDHGLCVRGCVDLRYLVVRSTKYELGNFGLKDLTIGVLGFTLEKSTHVRCSDWQAKQLTNEQVQYAAADALVAIEIFTRLVHDKLSAPHSERDVRQKALSICQGIVDVKFSLKSAGIKTNKEQRMGGGKRPKDLFKPVSRAYTARNKPLYHNCQLWAPDGQLLCTCDVKKALWYVEKGLGTKVRDEPLTVQLKFEPSGRPVSEANYYLQEKQNQCVVCGRPDSYTKKNIVPHEYRKYFPSVMKDHKSHDVVLLCLRCHQQSSENDTALRQYLEKKCEAPLGSAKSAKFTQDHSLARVRSAGKALLHGGGHIPAARREQLEQVVRDYYQLDVLSTDVLLQASKLDPKLLNENFTCHGEKVVSYMAEHDGLVAFERMWRQHFLDTMGPQYLPPLWSVDHSHDRLAALSQGLPSSSSKAGT